MSDTLNVVHLCTSTSSESDQKEISSQGLTTTSIESIPIKPQNQGTVVLLTQLNTVSIDFYLTVT